MPKLQLADSRRWGIEIENSEWNRYGNALMGEGFGLHHDESVDHECRCDCDECEHECDCEHCEISNGYDDPSHCDRGNCNGNELVSRVFYTPEPNELAEVDRVGRWLSDYSWNDSRAGMHIHVEARDLTIAKGQTLLTIWNHFLNLSEQDHFGFFGRQPNNYCNRMPKRLEQAGDKMQQINFKGVFYIDSYSEIVEELSRPTDLNPYGVPTDTKKTTVEFRGFAPSYVREVIEYRAKVCRTVVEYVAQGLPPYWLLRHKTEADFMKELFS